jgi:hypothetical protein
MGCHKLQLSCLPFFVELLVGVASVMFSFDVGQIDMVCLK